MFVAISFATYRTNNRNYVSIVTITHTKTTNTTYINKPITKTYIYIYVCIRMYIHVYIYIYTYMFINDCRVEHPPANYDYRGEKSLKPNPGHPEKHFLRLVVRSFQVETRPSPG